MNRTNEREDTQKTNEPAKPICKLGLDCHAASITVARQQEGLNPQPPQKFAVGRFLQWVEQEVKKGFAVFSCYEAGPTGYWLHRKLAGLGVKNIVVCPTRLDSRGRESTPTRPTPRSWSCDWIAMWRATRKLSRWCQCPQPKKSKSG